MISKVEEMAPIILDAIKGSSSILLHCHPSPDPDSVGSVLAMKFALESLGKKVTAIRGDSAIPLAFMHFPGADSISPQSFGETNLSDFDLFIILDSGSPTMISRTATPAFPLSIKTIVIDHHASNTGYADINLIDLESPASGFVLFKLFKQWNIAITPDMAANLFIAIYTDTGGFKYPPTDWQVIEAAAELAKIAPNYRDILSKMENSKRKEAIIYEALALSSLKTFFDDRLAITFVGNDLIVKNSIKSDDIGSVPIASIVASVAEFGISVSLSEETIGTVRVNFRTKDSNIYDVSKLALALGGGGHKASSGARLYMPMDEAIKKVVETAKILYNF